MALFGDTVVHKVESSYHNAFSQYNPFKSRRESFPNSDIENCLS